MNEQTDRLTYIERMVGELREMLVEVKARGEESSKRSETDHQRLHEKVVEVKDELDSVAERLTVFEKEHATIKGEIKMLQWVGAFAVGIAVICQPIISWIRGK